ncbi:MAG: TIGR00300 family protein [Nitrospinae bacterium]|nr:TIGR00300 family protein [Nitrospinota bacterium]
MPQLVIEGQIVRDNLLQAINRFMEERKLRYSIVDFHLGARNEDPSSVIIDSDIDPEGMDRLSELLKDKGAWLLGREQGNPVLLPSEKDRTVPDNFYSTTHHPTELFLNGKWVPVRDMRMDAVLSVEGGGVVCRKLRDIKKGDLVVCGTRGIRIHPPTEKTRLEEPFAFMGAEVSSERRTDLAARTLAAEMKRIGAAKGKIVFVAGPVLVHTGGGEAFSSLIKKGYVHAFLGNNAIAVHDIEADLYGTSLGVDLQTGLPASGGHKNHMRAINAISKAGSIKEAVEQGVLKSGIMFNLARAGVPFSLAGSIRDDGPLPDTEMDLLKAQENYAALLKGAELVVMLSSMLHSIGAGNMLGSQVKVVCVDINPAVVSKLRDRGSMQTLGIVTDAGLFVKALDENL